MSSAHTPTEALFARALIVEDLDEPRQWLAELLPLSLQERQILLEMDEPEQRLEELLQILPRFQKA